MPTILYTAFPSSNDNDNEIYALSGLSVSQLEHSPIPNQETIQTGQGFNRTGELYETTGSLDLTSSNHKRFNKGLPAGEDPTSPDNVAHSGRRFHCHYHYYSKRKGTQCIGSLPYFLSTDNAVT